MSVIILSVIMLRAIMLNIVMLSVIILNIFRLCEVMLGVINRVIMMSLVILSYVVVLSCYTECLGTSRSDFSLDIFFLPKNCFPVCLSLPITTTKL